MKKYLLGLTAIIMAVAFSAFTKAKFVNDILKPTLTPTAAGRVADETKWSDNGTGSSLYNCTGTTQDVVCRVLADPKYTHIDGNGDLVLNVPNDTPPGEFQLTVFETTGLSQSGTQYYIIDHITSTDATDSRGSGFDFVNAVK